MKIAKIKYLLQMLTLFVLVTSCLPTQKTTECSSSEAFDAAKRKCVPTLGAGIGNTVFIQAKFPANSYSTSLGDAGITHTIAVSDVYAVGYKTQWKLHFSSSVSPVYNFNNSLVSSNTLNYTFTPPSVISPNLKGTYILEAIVLNNDLTAQLDSHSWTIQVGDLAVPELINPVPSVIATTFALNLGAQTLSLDIDNPDTRTGLYTWYLDSIPQGVATVFSAATSTQTFAITPSSLGAGIHTLELKITDQTNPVIVFDNYIWTINIISPDYPAITTATPSFSDTIIAIDGIDYSSGGYLDSSFTALNALATPGLCINVDNYDKDGDLIPDLDVQFDINGTIQGALAQIGATNQYCLTTISAQNLVNPQIGVSKTFTVSTYVSGTATLVEQRQWPLIVNPKNSAPTIAIDSNATNSTISCSAMSTLSASGCTMTQSADTDNDNDYTDETAANNNSVQVSFSVYDMETDFNNTGAFGAGYDEDDIEIYFQVKAAADINYQDMDATPGQYTRTNCTLTAGSKAAMYAANQASGYSKTYICNLNMDSFYTDGVNDFPVASGSYVVRAYVRDAGSQWAPANQQQSTYITWNINVGELDSTATISAQNFVGPAAATNSWIELSDSLCTNTTTELTSVSADIPENGYLIVHSLVNDDERDNLKILVEMENLVAGIGSYSIVVPVTNVTENYDATNPGYVDVQSCFKIPEWATTVTGTTVANIRVTTTEVLDSGLSASSDTEIFNVNITNDNPAPVFADNSDLDLAFESDGITPEQTVVMAGFPFVVNPELRYGVTPNAITDTSVYDGTNLKWQWQVCVGDDTLPAECDPTVDYDGATTNLWTNITNANSDNMSSIELTWTPNLDITPGSYVHLRVCLGDDGDGNPEDCSVITTNTSSYLAYTNIIVSPASFIDDNAIPGSTSSGNELATWFDETNGVFYEAYVSATTIYVSKFKQTTTADQLQWERVHTISFTSEDETVPLVSTIPSSLSISGIDGGVLLVAYKVIDTGSYQPRIRQIDISGDTLSFNYHGIYTGAGIMADNDDIISASSGFVDGDLSSVSAGALDITFDGTEDNTYSLTFDFQDGTTSTVLCGGCMNGAASTANADAFVTALGLDANFSKYLYITSAAGSSVVEIRGAYQDNYIDINSYTDTISNIVINSQASPSWYIGYRNSLGGGLSVHHASGADVHLSTAVPATYDVAGSSTVVDYLSAAINSADSLIIAQKSNTANVDIHELTYPIGSGTTTETNLFTITSAQITDINVSIGSSDHIYIAGVYDTNAGDRYLCASVINGGDLTDYSSTSYFSSTNFLAQSGIDRIKVAADPAVDGKAIIALTTNSDHKYDNGSAVGSGIPNQAHLVKITQNVADFSQAINFVDYQINATDLSSPKVNINSTIDLSAISLTPMYQATLGHSDDSDNALEDNQKYSVFFSFHESNGGTEIRNAILNVESTETSTDETSVSGSYPGILKD